MAVVSGPVTRTWTKSITSKAGKTFNINYVEVDGQPVNVGFKQPYRDGEVVNITCETAFGELKATPAGSSGTSSAPAPFPSKAAGGFPIEKRSREMAIIRQNSLTNAVNTFTNAIKPTTTVDMEELSEEIINLAYKYAEFSSGHREERKVKELAEQAK